MNKDSTAQYWADWFTPDPTDPDGFGIVETTGPHADPCKPSAGGARNVWRAAQPSEEPEDRPGWRTPDRW